MTAGLRIKSTDASRIAGKGGTIPQPASMDIEAGQLVAITGPGDEGATTPEILARIRESAAEKVSR